MADLIFRLPFLSVVSTNDVKHMQMALVWGERGWSQSVRPGPGKRGAWGL